MLVHAANNFTVFYHELFPAILAVVDFSRAHNTVAGLLTERTCVGMPGLSSFLSGAVRATFVSVFGFPLRPKIIRLISARTAACFHRFSRSRSGCRLARRACRNTNAEATQALHTWRPFWGCLRPD